MIDIKSLKDRAKNFSVLYVEDDASIRDSMTVYLGKFFSKVEVATNGLEGLDAYAQEKFDLVITDLSMPKMDGLEMLTKIRELSEEQTILITSAHGESHYMLEAIKHGIDGYIIKPFDYEQLNYELFKIVTRLQKYKESGLYKEYLENLIDKKSSEVSSLISFQNENYEQTLYSMVEMIEDRDTYTAGHSKRVATYSQMIAKEMGYSEEECTQIFQAGMLHDIGKIATPDAVLLNPKKLNDIEYILIQEHVRVGYKLLSNVPMFSSLAEIVYSHHERFDGQGYPRGLKGDEIQPLARIMVLADAFDAITTSRIYKGRKSVSDALVEIESLSGLQFHPDVVKSALVALKDLEVENNINQLPHTQLEQERFAYFYKDELTSAYNSRYLEMILIKNSYEKEYKCLYLVSLKDFSSYNKKYSWKEGDDLLGLVSKGLQNCFLDSLVFRIFGDDFVILSKKEHKIASLHTKIDKVFQELEVEYSLQTISLAQKSINSIDDIERVTK